MQKSFFVVGVVFTAACGTEVNSNVVSVLPAGGAPLDSSQAGSVGFVGENFFKLGSKTQNTRNAFKSVGKINHGDGSRRCTGVFAYDRSSGQPALYFYSAAHCFEERDSLGRLKKQSLGVARNVYTYNGHFVNDKNLTKHSLGDGPQGFRYKTVNNFNDLSDVTRIFYRNLSDAEVESYLPICAGSTSDEEQMRLGKQSISVNRADTLLWTDFHSEKNFFPESMLRVLRGASESPIRYAVGLKVRPGDSGAPVFVYSRDAATKGIKYHCVSGIVTRESWSRSGGKCDKKLCKMEGNTIWEKIRPTSSEKGNWVAIEQ
jgi:hypothetical protein